MKKAIDWYTILEFCDEHKVVIEKRRTRFNCEHASNYNEKCSEENCPIWAGLEKIKDEPCSQPK